MNGELKFLWIFFWGGRGRVGGGGGQLGMVSGWVCRRIEVFVKIKKKWGGGLGRGVGLGDQGGCERRIEVVVEIKKKWGGGVGSGRGCQGGCERRIEVFVKIQLLLFFLGGGVGLGGSGLM